MAANQNGREYTSGFTIIDMLSINRTCERSTVPSSGVSKYLTPLLVHHGEPVIYGYNGPPEKYKIIAALNHLGFREQHFLIQFWSPRVAGRHVVLTSSHQPFGISSFEKGICSYRRESDRKLFLVNKDREDEDLSSPPARVFRRGLPEWTCDVTNYMLQHFPQQDTAINSNLCGYLALPVFDLASTSCVGVLELLMPSNSMGYAFEVKQIQAALQAENLATPNEFYCPMLDQVPNEQRQNELAELHYILKIVCETHCLPLAQIWTPSQLGAYVSHEKVLVKSCNSFSPRCIGKVCMSTNALPFHVRDLSKWHFREICREQHLNVSRGFVGRALASRGSSFCEDVTKLTEEEYPFVHDARLCGLTGCLAVYLHGSDDYVLEFFLPLDFKESAHVLNMVHTMKQKIESFAVRS